MAAPNLGQLIATTIPRYQKEITDQIFNGSKTLMAFTKKGMKERWDGGAPLRFPLEYARNPNTKWMSEFAQYDILPVNVIDASNHDWVSIATTVNITHKEKVLNSGQFAAIRLSEAKIKNAATSITERWNLDIFNDGTDADAFQGLRYIISSANTYGGIDRTVASNAFFRPSYTDTAAEPLTIAKIAASVDNSTYGMVGPDMMVTTLTLYEKFEALAESFKLISQSREGTLGFDHLYFRGIPLWWERDCPAGHFFTLTSGHLKMICHPDWEFKVLPARETTQPLEIIPIEWWGQFICTGPRWQALQSGKTA
ncbi:MAG: phage major capsid protein [Candidatus Methylomirabilales bacterium]